MLEHIDVFVLDLDGTIYLGDTLIDGAGAFLDAIRAAGKRYVFFTNNSSRSPHYCIEKLNRFGIATTRDEFMTSVDVTIDCLKKERPGQRFYLLGTPDLEEAFLQNGLTITNRTTHDYDYAYGLTACAEVREGELPDAVVAGFDKTLNYEKLERACAYIQKGAAFLAIHPDITCPMEHGAIPDCGAICAAITASTGMAPHYYGKPSVETVAYIMRHFDIAPERIAFVGDRLYTDIQAGVANGSKGILVLTGETGEAEIAAASVRPDAVFASVKEIAEALSDY
ncbi:MAG: HAD-IIA family hydrolase [Lachnospiraceae bacterium]|nr:HAD-IIA family hydrolase [Lachnospiraceae bacterium]